MPTSVLRRMTTGMQPIGLPYPPTYRPASPLIGPWAPESIGQDLVGINAGLPASGSWPTANLSVAVPFYLSDYYLVRKVWWFNGATVTTDSVDVGVYSEAFSRLVSGGGTTAATGGANVIQEVDVTDTLLAPGRYYIAYVQNGTTVTPTRAAFFSQLATMGCAQMGTNYPLGTTFTPAVISTAHIPMFGISNRLQTA